MPLYLWAKFILGMLVVFTSPHLYSQTIDIKDEIGIKHYLRRWDHPALEAKRLETLLGQIDRKEKPSLWLRFYARWLDTSGSAVTGFNGDLDALIRDAEERQVFDALVTLRIIEALFYQNRNESKGTPRGKYEAIMKLCEDKIEVACLSAKREFARVLSYSQDHSAAIKMSESVVAEAENLGLEFQIEAMLSKNFLAMSFGQNNDKERAIKLYEEINSFVDQHRLRFVGAAIKYNLANMYIDESKKAFPEAVLRLFTESKLMSQEVDDTIGVAWGLLGIGSYYVSHLNPQKAKQAVEEGLAIAETSKDLEVEGELRIELAKIYLLLQEPSLALHELKVAKPKIPSSFRKTNIEFLEVQHKAYRSLNQTEASYKSLEELYRLTKDVWREEKETSLARHQSIANLRLEEQRNQNLQTNLAMQANKLKDAQKIRDLSLSLLALLLLLFAFFISLYLHAQKISRQRRRMASVLEILDQGIFVINKQLKISVTLSYPEFLGKDQHQETKQELSIRDFLLALAPQCEDEINVTQSVLALAFDEDAMMWGFNAHQLLQEVRLLQSKKVIGFFWQAITQKSVVHEILLCVQDLTEKHELQAHQDDLSQRSNWFQEILSQHPQRALQAIHSLQEDWEFLLRQDSQSEALPRHLHKHKGVARSLGLKYLAVQLHQWESLWQASPIPGSQAIREVQHNIQRFLQNSQQMFAQLLTQEAAATRDLGSLWDQAKAHLMQRCREHHIEYGGFHLLDDYGHWQKSEWQLLEQMTPLLINNAFDHGYLFPQERGEKPRAIRLEWSMQLRDGELQWQFRDFGFGLYRQEIQKKALELGLSLHSDEELIRFLKQQQGVSSASGLSETSGRGLGLSAIFAMVAEAQGECELENHGDQGLSLWVKLPKALARAAS